MLNKISVIGLGYIGLPTAAMFASKQVPVLGVDINPEAVDTINRGEVHIVEPDLDAVVATAVSRGLLRASTEAEAADAFLIAVPTPFKNDKQPDLRFIEAACKSIAPVLSQGNIVVLESTSPVGATAQMCQWLKALRPDLRFPGEASADVDIHVAHCPERVLPGKVMRELVENDRVIGGMTPECAEKAAELYRTFVQGECVLTNCETAEMAKLTENAFRDVNIAFANELSVICDEVGINVWELIAIANRHPRVNVLQPGPGVGGHCIAVDPWFIVSRTPELARLIRTARDVNDHKPEWTLEKIRSAVLGLAQRRDVSPNSIKVACFGLAFKPDIDDLRESPALSIAQKVATEFSQVALVEPYIDTLPEAFVQTDAKLVDIDTALQEADVLVLLVDHSQFKAMSPASLQGKTLVDCKGIWG